MSARAKKSPRLALKRKVAAADGASRHVLSIAVGEARKKCRSIERT
jgi:hypothetical protein